MIYLNANRSAAYRWDGRAYQFEFFFFGGAVALARQAAAGVETILQGQFALLDALPYDTYEAAAAPYEALRDRLTAALELGRWPDEGEKEL